MFQNTQRRDGEGERRGGKRGSGEWSWYSGVRRGGRSGVTEVGVLRRTRIFRKVTEGST